MKLAPGISRRRAIRRTHRHDGERGTALVEFAIAVPVLFLIFSLIFDAGLGFAASRENSAAVRTATRIAAEAGDARNADYLALDSLRAAFADNSATVKWISIYQVAPNTNGEPPAGCGAGEAGVVAWCNVYPGSMLDNMIPAFFDAVNCAGDYDYKFCAPDMRANGDLLGITVWSEHEPTIGLIKPDIYQIKSTAVFAIYAP